MEKLNNKENAEIHSQTPPSPKESGQVGGRGLVLL